MMPCSPLLTPRLLTPPKVLTSSALGVAVAERSVNKANPLFPAASVTNSYSAGPAVVRVTWLEPNLLICTPAGTVGRVPRADQVRPPSELRKSVVPLHWTYV